MVITKNNVVLSGLFLTVLLTGCSEQDPMDRHYENETEYKKIGRCEDGGDLSRVNYTGFNKMGLFDEFIYLLKPDKWSYCIPYFDANKAKDLNHDAKEKLDASFFNAQKNRNRVERVKSSNGDVRYQSISLKNMQDLVRQGSELAYLDLHLFDYYQHYLPFNFTESDPYYQRLKTLSENGDAEALCLFSNRIPTPFPGYDHLKDPPPSRTPKEMLEAAKSGKPIITEAHLRRTRDRYETGPENKWIKGTIKAAKMGSSECMSVYGGMLLRGNENIGLQKNTDEGLKYLTEAAKKGSARAAGGLALSYIIGKELPYDLGKYACWAEIHNRTLPEPYSMIDYKHRIKTKTWVNKNLEFTKYSPDSFCQNAIEE